jgi:hypothetical protein
MRFIPQEEKPPPLLLTYFLPFALEEIPSLPSPNNQPPKPIKSTSTQTNSWKQSLCTTTIYTHPPFISLQNNHANHHTIRSFIITLSSIKEKEKAEKGCIPFYRDKGSNANKPSTYFCQMSFAPDSFHDRYPFAFFLH